MRMACCLQACHGAHAGQEPSGHLQRCVIAKWELLSRSPAPGGDIPAFSRRRPCECHRAATSCGHTSGKRNVSIGAHAGPTRSIRPRLHAYAGLRTGPYTQRPRRCRALTAHTAAVSFVVCTADLCTALLWSSLSAVISGCRGCPYSGDVCELREGHRLCRRKCLRTIERYYWYTCTPPFACMCAAVLTHVRHSVQD